MTLPGAEQGGAGETGLRAPDPGKYLRRLATVSGVHLALFLLLASAPLWLPVLALLGCFQSGSFPALRCFLYLTWLMACECTGLLLALLIWLRPRGSRAIWLRRHYSLQSFWVGALFAGAQHLLGIRLQVEGGDELARGRVLVLMRHASVVDAVLPDLVAARPFGLQLRYVLKRELRISPCLDIVGDRLPNAFVRRGSPDAGPEIARVKELAEGLGPRDGVLLFPEGTRFTPERQAKIRGGLEARGDLERLASARRLFSVLPIRWGGVLGLIETDPGADVVFCAHTGTEKLTRLGDLISGAAQGALLRVGCWRVPADSIPRDVAGRKAWLDTEWERVDAWVRSHSGEEAVPPP